MATVNPTTTTNTTGNTSAPKNEAQKQKDQFLQILMTQLQNQNPLDPQKPAEFASQLAQFSGLEQQINTNSKLDSLLKTLASNNVSPVGYLGTTVDYDSAVAPVQSDHATWSYSVAGATSVKLEVTDSVGNIIYSGDGDTTSVMQTLNLEAKGAPNGMPLTLKITAKDKDGKVVTPVITSRAKITAVTTADGVTTLEADGYAIATSAVKRIGTTQTTAKTEPETKTETETNS